MDDGIHTLAINHHQVTAIVEHDRVENPGGDLIIRNSEARRVGLLWSRRRGAEKRAGIDLSDIREETEDEAMAAGRQMRTRLGALLNQIPDLPERYNPNDQAPLGQSGNSPQNEVDAPSKRKYRRIEMAIETDEEEDAQSELTFPNLNISTSTNQRNGQQLSLVQNSKAALSNRGAHRNALSSSFLDYEAEDADDDAEEREHTRGHTSSPTQSHSERQTDSDSDSDLSFVVNDDFFD